MRDIQDSWNVRAKLLGDSFRSVMEQSFPHVVNETIHAIHVREIIRAMPKETKEVLDVGCGWGRIASDLVQNRNVHVSGIDISSHFVKLFNKRLKKQGKAVVSDMRHIPFGDNSFDLVYCVVSLMYLSSQRDQKRAMSEMLRVLKKGGRLVLIEPNRFGVSLVRLGGLVPWFYRILLKKSKKVETYGIAFRRSEVEALIKRSGGTILYKKGYPGLTFLLLPSILIGKAFPIVSRIVLSIASFFDQIIPIATPSYFTTWVIKKTSR